MVRLSSHAAERPRLWFWVSGLLSLLLILLVLVPTLIPGLPVLHALQIDTDPENMLRADEPVREFHSQMKKTFSLADMIVVGVVNKEHPKGVFNPESLSDIYHLAEYAKTISWIDDNTEQGVISIDVIAPSSVDNIEQAGLGAVQFEWLMPVPPENETEAAAIADKAMNIPLLNDTLVSQDRRAIALYIPLTSKDISYQVAELLRDKIGEFDNGDEYYITGLPIAQDQFGIEMFKQMAISAPLAMLLIFALMWWFFRQVRLVIAPLVVAFIAVILTMGMLVVTGNTIHIMSSMIPIFIMPIAVLDAVHILSDFFDRYPHYRDRATTLKVVMEELSSPMLYTSLTTCAGFASLAFTPIPPVQVFGIFVALGVFLAWLLTITLIPAYIMLMPESSMAHFGMKQEAEEIRSPMSGLLALTARTTFRKARVIVIGSLALIGLAAYGIQQIQINDNPVKWFAPDHSIRVADRALNERFGGTYMAYLTLQPSEAASLTDAKQEVTNLVGRNAYQIKEVSTITDQVTVQNRNEWFKQVIASMRDRQDEATSDDEWEAWDKLITGVGEIHQRAEIFKNPEVLNYIGKLQEHLQTTGMVGKSSSLPDIVKTVHRELFLGESEAFRIPTTPAAVGQTLITYQSGHRPHDLWHFVTPDYRMTNLWIQLKSGDNKDMAAVVSAVDQFLADNPPPVALSHGWFGLTYINVVWQEKMVNGMLEAFMGSFIIVLLMMTFLFRSMLWGILSMLPLLMTIGLIYGVIGLIGKDYDMPVAVLSALSLGLAIDYAIHFLARSRQIFAMKTSWQETLTAVFQEPARAISRNVIVVGAGFLPLLAAPLVPYQTVGVFISAILVLAGVSTLLLLPALITLFSSRLFRPHEVSV